MTTLERGTTVGGYRLIGQHWDGGLGATWVAQKVRGGEHEELFLVRFLDEVDSETRGRLLAWGCAMAAMDEPTVAKPTDFIFEDGHTAVVSELVIGESLRQVSRVVRGWSPLLALSSVLVLARALQRMEETRDDEGRRRQIRHGHLDIHRVFVDYDSPRLVILDMGLEQTLAPRDDATRRDVHSLGLILWELMSGRTAGDGKLPSLKSCGVRTTPRLDGLIRCATATKADNRYSSLPAFIKDLQRCLDTYRRTIDVPGQLSRIVRQRLSHRAHAVQLLVSRWRGSAAPTPRPSAPAPKTPYLRTVAARPRPSNPPGTTPLPLLTAVEYTPHAPLHLAEPMTAELSLPGAVPAAATADLSGPVTTDLPRPPPKALETLRQFTWLGVLALFAIAGSAYFATESGQASVATWGHVLRGIFGGL